MEGIIIEIKPEKYIIEVNGQEYTAVARGNIKKKDRILVGDRAVLSKDNDVYVIEDIKERKNSIIRPPICNIDQMFCIVSKTYPVPDLMMLDKQIVLCEKNNITPVICINKADLLEENENYAYIKEVYSNIGYKVIEVSAEKDAGLDQIIDMLKGKISAMSGLSGVGKSSIAKQILKHVKEEIEIGDLTEKINRGKHTTKYVKLYYINGGYLADTPGFSSLELVEGIEKEDLKEYYVEFLKHPCRYKDCNHVTESIEECNVKKAVEDGNIDSKRYEKYKKLYMELEIKDKQKYKKKKR